MTWCWRWISLGYRDAFAPVFDEQFDPGRVASLIADGMVDIPRAGVSGVSAEGFPVLDAVVANLAA